MESQTFTHFQIQLDDTEDSDALAFFPQCISFIENELDNGRGVLVHCQAGMSTCIVLDSIEYPSSNELVILDTGFTVTRS